MLSGAALATVGGSAVLEEGTHSTVQTRFQVASVAKQFVAVAALLLVERGELELDEPVGRWFAHAPAAWRAITPHHLLTHTSGLGHWSGLPGLATLRTLDHDERLRLVAEMPLQTPPGTQWTYSGPGYLVLGDIVAKAAGAPYPAFLAEHLLRPLGLDHTSVGVTPTGPAVATGHRDGEPVPLLDLSMMPGTGDIWSTVGDLARFATSLHRGHVLSADSVRTLVARHIPIDTPAETGRVVVRDGYGYGLDTGTVAGHRAAFHAGDNPGFVSFLAWLPEADAALVVLSDDEATDIPAVLTRLAGAATSRT